MSSSNQTMEVDEQTKKMERDFEGASEFHDPQQTLGQDEETPVPTELAAPEKTLELGDLMKLMTANMDETTRGREENRTSFAKIDRELAHTKREIQETKTMAAKATTIATETRSSLQEFEKRVASLEKGEGPKTTPRNHSSRPFAPPGLFASGPQRDWDYLGGEEGNTTIVSGFRTLASKEERRQEWDDILQQLPEALKEAISETIIPNSPGEKVIIKVAQAATTKDTRIKCSTGPRNLKNKASQ